MPMVPEGLFAMLASARIGAIHSVVFGGFSATELASRIIDCQPTLMVCSSCGFEPNKTIDYKAILNEALVISQ
jgi:propionyl-CoA synthetase